MKKHIITQVSIVNFEELKLSFQKVKGVNPGAKNIEILEKMKSKYQESYKALLDFINLWLCVGLACFLVLCIFCVIISNVNQITSVSILVVALFTGFMFFCYAKIQENFFLKEYILRLKKILENEDEFINQLNEDEVLCLLEDYIIHNC